MGGLRGAGQEVGGVHGGVIGLDWWLVCCLPLGSQLVLFDGALSTGLVLTGFLSWRLATA